METNTEDGSAQTSEYLEVLLSHLHFQDVYVSDRHT